MAVHQLIPSFVSGDATGQAALHFQLLLRRLGHFGNIYAGEVEPSLSSLALPARALRPEPDDLVLYHHGIASPLAGRVLHLRCRTGMVFHNITPARFYEGTPLHEPLVSGRAQLAALAPWLDLAIGVSRYNSRELEVVGAKNVHVVPLFIEPERFLPEAADRTLAAKLGNARNAPTIVSVSRIAPHKRFEDLLALHEESLRLNPDARLIVVGGYDSGSRYWKSLRRRMKGLRGITFTGRVSHAELVAAYRAGSVFVSMSEHEGFGVPLLEAMACDLPVLAFAAAAVPETLGGAGIAFTEKRFAFLAELVHELHHDHDLREKVLRGQRRRLEELSAARAEQALGAALSSIGIARPHARRPRADRRPKVAIVVQRFGDEVTGGAEKHARDVADRLAPYWDITVLTTCAKDHLTWKNELPAGPDRVGRLKVLRFPARRVRDIHRFNALSRTRFGRPLDRMHEEHWIAEQGPLVPDLFEHLAHHAADYDGFVFFTYLYAPTVWGLPMVAQKALLVPTVHDEPPLYFHAYADALERPRALLCNTPEEQALIARRSAHAARARVVGVGVEPLPGNPERFRRQFHLDRPYLLYVGRIEPGKGVDALLRHYRALRRSDPGAPDLVLAGALHMTLGGEGVRYVGRLSEQEKWDALSGARAVVVPSRFESLSLLALESFAAGAPVVANGDSDVLRGQCERSGAGRCYTDAASFVEAVEDVTLRREELSRKGRAFAKKHSWEAVVRCYREELDRIIKETRR
ncbi:MAG: glycosyltransferase [Myxococcaceae bacterium]|nr:glycosyltransferase [Myxococcaceae bacterium]